MKKSFFIIYLNSVLITGIILYLSFFKPPQVPKLNEIAFFDKWVHVLLYTLYTLIMAFDFTKDGARIFKKTYYWGVCVAFPVLLGGVIEIMQVLLFPPRTAEWLDWAADATGVLIGMALHKTYVFLFKKS